MSTFGPFLGAAAIAGLVGLVELLSRYRDHPRPLFYETPAWLYVVANALSGAAGLWLIRVLGLMPDDAFPDARAIAEVLIAGFATLALFRSALFRIRVGDSDIDLGPSWLLAEFRKIIHRRLSQSQALHRNRIVANIMEGVDFERAKGALTAHCLSLMDDLPSDEQEATARQIDAYSDVKSLQNRAKCLRLGLILLPLVGEKVLEEAVEALRDDIAVAVPQSQQPGP